MTKKQLQRRYEKLEDRHGYITEALYYLKVIPSEDLKDWIEEIGLKQNKKYLAFLYTSNNLRSFLKDLRQKTEKELSSVEEQLSNDLIP